MTREDALALVKDHLHNKNLVKHCLAVEACMRTLAVRFGQDAEIWGLAGLLHDLDYELTEKSPDLHTLETMKLLADRGLAPEILHAIQAHAGKAPCLGPICPAESVPRPAPASRRSAEDTQTLASSLVLRLWGPQRRVFVVGVN